MADENYKSAYEILKHPFSNMRRRVADKFLSQKLTLDDFIDINKALLQEAENNDNVSVGDLSIEIRKAYRFLKTGEIEDTPDISNSAKQLIWGTALACSQSDPTIRQNWPSHISYQPIQKLKVWNDIKEGPTARAELRRHAFMVSRMSFLPQEEDISMRWGSCNYPNVGFYFDKEHSRINLDMLWALIGGFEHSRAMQLHEIGHGYGTLSFGEKMQDLQKQFDELNQKARTHKISKEEYRRLQEIEREYKYRFSIFDEAENSYANRFAANASSRVRQDIGYDLNSVETQLFSVGENIERNKDGIVSVQDTVGNRAYNLKQAIRLSFYVNNGIVEDKPEEWAKLGVNIDWIEYQTPEGEKISGTEAFNKLREMASSLEYMQVKERDYQKTDEEVYKLALEYAQKRGNVIDEIFDLYAMQYYEDAIYNKEKETPEKHQENQEEIDTQENNQQNDAASNSDSHDSDDNSEINSGDNDESEESRENTVSQGNEAESSESDSENGQGNTEGELQEDAEGINNQESQQEGASSDGDNHSLDDRETDSGDGNESEESRENTVSQGNEAESSESDSENGQGNTESEQQEDDEGINNQESQQEGASSDGDNLSLDDRKTDSGDGNESEESRENTDSQGNETESSESDSENGQGNTESEQQEDDEKRNYDDLSDEEKAHLREDENGNIEKDDFLSLFDELKEDEDMPPFEDFAQTPEEAYQEKILGLKDDTDENEDFENVMEIIRTSFENNEKERTNNKPYFAMGQDSVPFSMPKTLMPENEFSKIVVKHFDMIEQLKNKFTDLQNEYYDETDNVEVLSLIPETGNLKVDIPSYIDRLKKKLKGEELKESDFENFAVCDVGKAQTKAPIDIAILIDNSGSMHYAGTDQLAIELACSMFQATRDNPAFNVYVALMHNPTTWIAKPGDNSIEISERLATIYHGRTYGDDKIGDNIPAVLKEVQERDPSSKNEGNVNFFMITDGGHTDSGESFEMVDKIASKDVPLTFNWLLTDSIKGNYVQDLIENHQTGIGSRRIDYEDDITHENMLPKLMSLIEKRMQDTKQIEAIRASEKQADMSFILQGLGYKRGDYNG